VAALSFRGITSPAEHDNVDSYGGAVRSNQHKVATLILREAVVIEGEAMCTPAKDAAMVEGEKYGGFNLSEMVIDCIPSKIVLILNEKRVSVEIPLQIPNGGIAQFAVFFGSNSALIIGGISSYLCIQESFFGFLRIFDSSIESRFLPLELHFLRLEGLNALPKSPPSGGFFACKSASPD
jgi:hypothetical protein